MERVVETNVEPVSGAGEFYAGEEVDFFYIGNEGMTDIYPSDHLRADFVVYTVIDGRDGACFRQMGAGETPPTNGTNLEPGSSGECPDKAVGRMCWVQCRINSDRLADERNPDNNSREFAILLPQVRSTYRTPDTRYEEKAPADYRPDAERPASKSASATWTQWVYENGAFVLKSTESSIAHKTVTDAGCLLYDGNKGERHRQMKSGYGVNLRWRGTMNAVSGVPMAPASSYTGIQNVTALFPEYGYEAADGRAETLVSVGNYYQLVGNTDAGGARVHFIPLYHRDGSYRVVLKTGGIWTPAGYPESVRLSNEIVISGTVYDDWYNK